MNTCPVIACHGIFGFGPKELGELNYWGSGMKVKSPQPKFEASVGPISSAHDRACELAAQIKGSLTNYGKEHATLYGHNVTGVDFTGKGFHPSWSENQPVHLVGHSLGGPTIRCLQYLLSIDFFGWGSNEKWVKSMTGISPVFNGSTLTYMLGCNENTGLIPKAGTAANAIFKFIELFTSMTGALFDSIYDFDLNHWGFERGDEESLGEYLGRIKDSPIFTGKDNAAYTLTLQGAYDDNGIWPTFPDTYYFSIVTEQTTKWWWSETQRPDWNMNPVMIPTAFYMGSKYFSREPIPGYRDKDWFENDGAVNSYSQMYPRTNGNHPVGKQFKDGDTSFSKGVWNWQKKSGWDHMDIVMLPQWNQLGKQKDFYVTLFNRLAAL